MFTSPESFTLSVNNATKNWDGMLQYSTDTTNWAEWDGTTTLSSVNNKLYLRGTGNTKITGGSNYYKWVLTGSNISCDGNIETLLDYQTALDGQHPTMANHCYANMFNGCTSLTTAPELSATTLADSCYYYMFHGCTSLTAVPALPAITLVYRCYYFMFGNCSKIKLSTTKTGTYTQEYRIPTNGTGTTAFSALDAMFSDTGGTFTGTPEINTTYYLDSSNYIV